MIFKKSINILVQIAEVSLMNFVPRTISLEGINTFHSWSLSVNSRNFFYLIFIIILYNIFYYSYLHASYTSNKILILRFFNRQRFWKDHCNGTIVYAIPDANIKQEITGWQNQKLTNNIYNKTRPQSPKHKQVKTSEL